MFARRPARHVQPNLAEDLQSAQAIDAINLRQVDSGHRLEIRVDLKGWGVTLACAPFPGRRRPRRLQPPHA